MDAIVLAGSLATLGIAFFAGVSEAQLFLEARYTHLVQFFRAGVERHRNEFKEDYSQRVLVGSYLVNAKQAILGSRRKSFEFEVVGLGGVAPSFFDSQFTFRPPFVARGQGAYFFEQFPRSLYGDFDWPRTVPLQSIYRSLRARVRDDSLAAGNDAESRAVRHASQVTQNVHKMVRAMWMWRHLMTIKWIGISLTLLSSVVAIYLSSGGPVPHLNFNWP